MYISVIVHLPAGCTCEESVISFCLRAAGYGLTLCYALGLPVGGAIQVSQLLLLLLITEKNLPAHPVFIQEPSAAIVAREKIGGGS